MRRGLLRGSPRSVADGSWGVGRKTGSSSSDEGPSAVFLEGKRGRMILD